MITPAKLDGYRCGICGGEWLRHAPGEPSQCAKCGANADAVKGRKPGRPPAPPKKEAAARKVAATKPIARARANSAKSK